MGKERLGQLLARIRSAPPKTPGTQAHPQAKHTESTAGRIAHHERKFKVKFKILLFLNTMFIPCRMYHVKPPHEAPRCGMCRQKGGWPRCRRSKHAAAKSNIPNKEKETTHDNHR